MPAPLATPGRTAPRGARAGLAPAAALSLAALLLAGCASPGLSRVRDDLARTMPEAEIGRGRSYGFGPVALSVARLFAGRGAAREGVDLRAVHRVRFATYPVRGSVEAASVRTPEALRRLTERGWTVLVRSREGGEATWVLYRSRGDDVTDLMTASLDAEELTLTHVSGDLDRLIRGVLAEHGAGFGTDAFGGEGDDEDRGADDRAAGDAGVDG